MSRENGTWRIGDLARETGLTVRTLRHYDQLGLLSPLARTEGGHRCYTSGDVRRLHCIVALRSLGVPLEQIGTLLNGETDRPACSAASSTSPKSASARPPTCGGGSWKCWTA